MLIPDRPFDPYDLRPLASLNRRRLIALPGIDPAWAGKTGWDLCSTPALIQLIQSRAAELGLEGAAPADLPVRLNDLLASSDPAVGESARAVAKTYGQRLGALVASILLSPDGLTTPLDPWEAAYLRHWRAEVQQLFLGGGLSNGHLGEITAREAEAMLQECGILQLRVRPASNPSYLPLIGAARNLPAGEERAAVIADFGSTWAKRALALYLASGELEELLVLPPVRIAPWIEPGKASQLAAEMVAILADTVLQAGPAPLTPWPKPPGLSRDASAVRLATDVTCCLAAYVVDGQPAPQTGANTGGYYGLHVLSNDLCDWFSEQVSQAVLASRVSSGSFGQGVSGTGGRAVRVHFAHDGGTAAAALAGQEKAAVIMLGSALGVGFVPPPGEIRLVAPDFNIFSLK